MMLSTTMRQTLALVQKNFRIFAKSPITTLVRALAFPILAITLLCMAKRLKDTHVFYDFVTTTGIASSSQPIKLLADAISLASNEKLVFVRNGIAADDLNPVINGIMAQPGMVSKTHVVLDDPNDLFWECRQTLRGLSDCFAAVIFTSYNATSAHYIIAVDSAVGSMDPDYSTHTSVSIDRLMPLQWAVDSQIGNFTTTVRPAELPWQGYLASADFLNVAIQSVAKEPPNPWFYVIWWFLAPVFILSFMGIVYHLSLSVATERQSGISKLLAAHTCAMTPRILSNLISFILLYMPGWIACSILITQILFERCSDILFLFLTLLAGLAIASSTHFVASFFRKSQLSGLYTSTFMFALAFVTIAFTLNDYPDFVSIKALCVLFPPITYVTLVADVAQAEIRSASYSLSASDVPVSHSYYDYVYPEFAGYLYIVFFLLQIACYTAGTFVVEKYLWGIKRSFKVINASDDVALRCTKLSKTYEARRRWYSPLISSPGVLAVDSLDLQLKKGSVAFLLGPNGGGKTTTLECISGMTIMDATSSLEINEDGLAFGVCPQGNVFWPQLTVTENINIWKKIKTAASSGGEDEDDAMVECGLLDKKHSAAKSLSGGQMRKLQLAIAFVGGSKMCCIDEATSGLDPLSRRSIWNIISKGRARRTVLMTTHFLDEADVLADHITIIYKGKVVCSGSATSLKAAYGNDYTISESEPSDQLEIKTWQMASSAEATAMVLTLERLSNNSYAVAFPTLEQVFLKVTNSGNIMQGVAEDRTVNRESVSEQVEEAPPGDIQHGIEDFDSGHAISIFRQIAIILRKRYILLRHNWISFSIAIATPIILAAALSSVLHYLPSFAPCESNFADLIYPDISPSDFAPLDPPAGYSLNWLKYSAVVGPPAAFQGLEQNELYTFSTEHLFQNTYDSMFATGFAAEQALNTRTNASSLNATITNIVRYSGRIGFGIFAATPDNTTILHQISNQNSYTSPEITLAGLSVITNRVSNASSVHGPARKVQTSYRTFRHVQTGADKRILPLALLVLLALMTSTAVSINYPTYERVNNMRAMQYCNGVSPMALWIAYLIFDMQVTIITCVVTWVLLFTGSATRLWFAPNYVLGAMILFGLASYLGAYVLSTFIRRAAFGVAAGLHLILFVLYILAYGLNQYLGSPSQRAVIYDQLQAGLGLTSPAANLGRAFFITTNNYDLACGVTGYEVQNPFAYNLYGGVYLYLAIQILFLGSLLFLIEYGSMEWFHKLRSKKSVPPHMPDIVLDSDFSRPQLNGESLDSIPREPKTNVGNPLLVVSDVSKRYGKISAVENASFNISPDETLALLGANGAGKTTMINMIRGVIKPNHGSIHLDGVSVIDHPQKARIQMGLCPQDDAIDQLTVRQTLNFFASIKGVKKVRPNVDKIMEAFYITKFENFTVKKLSGGTRRKLMVAIAIIGNPRVLLLDEPSTGLDAGAKRVLWKILRSLSSGRAVLLTSHSMEEVEALATEVAILGTRMLATGSLPHLRNAYGGSYRVRASYGPLISDSEAERVIADRFKDQPAKLVVRYGEANFELPHEPRRLGEIMENMEKLMALKAAEIRTEGGVEGGNELLFRDYTIAEPTMEMIFMNVLQRRGGEQALVV